MDNVAILGGAAAIIAAVLLVRYASGRWSAVRAGARGASRANTHGTGCLDDGHDG